MTTTARDTEHTPEQLPQATKHLHAIDRNAIDAAALVEKLRQQARDGDPDATPDALLNAQAVADHAVLLVDGARRQVEEARDRDRSSRLAALRAEIETNPVDSRQLAELAEKALTALGALHQAATARNAQMTSWRTRLQELGVPEHGNPLPPSENHHGLGHNAQQIIVGSHRLAELPPSQVAGQVLAAFAEQHRVDPRSASYHHNPGDIVAALATADGPVDIPTNLRFFETVGGGVISLDREPNAAERIGITREISQAAAWVAPH